MEKQPLVFDKEVQIVLKALDMFFKRTNAGVSLGVPTSNIDVCAFFHCHTTLHYCPETTSRITGPSQSNLDLAQSYNLPGILRDYKAPEITGGHDINDSKDMEIKTIKAM